MTKNTTKKTNAAKAPEPMDPSVFESAEGRAPQNHKRNAYALVTLVDEVRTMFPEVAYEFILHDGRNTALGVRFDLTGLADEKGDFITLLRMVGSDGRVNEIITTDESLTVVLIPSARTQDRRDPFGLLPAYDILFAGLDEEGSL
jgi:hypothetical protein